MVEFKEREEESVVLQEAAEATCLKRESPLAPPVVNDCVEESALILPEGFRMLEFVGEGGMAEVYKVESTVGCNVKAMKILKKDMLREVAASKRFLKECEAIQELQHENIVQIHGSGVLEDGRPYLLLEYIDGRTLKEVLHKEGALSSYRAVRIARQIAGALAEAHAKGIVHRDLKPSNILICKHDDGTELVRVVDFGIAKTKVRSLSETADLTKTGDIFGSPEYMSVEQCLGNPVDQKSDIYSFGCVLYEMLTGRSPFAAESPIKSILKHVEEEAEPFSLEHSKLKIPREIEQLVFDCLQKDPSHRPESASWLEKSLRSMIEPDEDPFRCDLIGSRLISTVIDIVLINIVAIIGTGIVHMVYPQAERIFSHASIFVAGFCIYKGLMESGSGRATLGMHGVLKVSDPTRGIIDFWRAFACPYVMFSVPMGLLGLLLHNTLLFSLAKNWVCPFAFCLAVFALVWINYVFGRRVTKGCIAHNHRKSPRFAYTLNGWQTALLLVSTWLYYLYFDAAFQGSTALFW